MWRRVATSERGRVVPTLPAGQSLRRISAPRTCPTSIDRDSRRTSSPGSGAGLGSCPRCRPATLPAPWRTTSQMALLIVRGLAPGRPVPSPVYLDANVLVSYFVRRTNSPAAVQAIAELLAQGVQTILSPLTISEFWWAIFDALYNHDRQSRGEPPQRLTPGEYRRHRAELHGRYRDQIALIRQQLQSWPGLRGVAFRPSGFRDWLATMDDCVDRSD